MTRGTEKAGQHSNSYDIELKKVLSLKSGGVCFYFFLTFVWGFRAMLALFIEPWTLQPIPAAAIGQLCASVAIFILMLIISGIFIKEIKSKK